MPNKRKTPSIASDDGDEDYRSKRDRNNQVSLAGPPLPAPTFSYIIYFQCITNIVY